MKFFPEVFLNQKLCVGFNLPFDLSRLAGKAGSTNSENPREGNILLEFTESSFLPNISIGRMGLAEEIKFRSRNSGKKGGEITPEEKFKGYFLDVAHLFSVLFGSGTEHFSLKQVCEMLDTTNKKRETEEHGIITEEYLEYLKYDVRSTADVYRALEAVFDEYELSEKPITKIYSGASIGKAFFKKMGIEAFLDQNRNTNSVNLGRIMETFYAGRVECKLRLEEREGEVLDFTSMYPSVIVLLGLWEFMKATGYYEIDKTEEIKEFVNSITLEEIRKPKTWVNLVGIVKIKPNKDILPIRTTFGEDKTKTVGIEIVTSEKEIWYTLADVVGSKLLTGKTPEIIQVFRYIPKKSKKKLENVNIFGFPFDPNTENFFKFLVEGRQGIKNTMKGIKREYENSLKNNLEYQEFKNKEVKNEKERKEKENKIDSIEKAYQKIPEYKKLDGKQLGMKILANALGYGIFIELITQKSENTLTVCRGGERFKSFGRSETEGSYYNPIIGTTITGAARLMLSIAEAKVKEMGFSHYYTDTDSIFVPPEIAKTVSNFFDPLNPYSKESGIKLLKVEDKFINYDKAGNRKKPQYFFGISSKRYVLYLKDKNGFPDKNNMECKLHGMGHISNPFALQGIGNKDWHKSLWLDIWNYEHGNISESEIEGKYSNVFEIAQISIRTPSVYNAFKEFNKGKNWYDQIKPFNFFNRGLSPKDSKMAPIAPRGKIAQEMVNFPFIDYKTGEIKEGKEYFKPLTETFFNYTFHPERKFKGDSGLLERREICIDEIKTIGKEIPTVDDSEIWLIEGEDVQVFEDVKDRIEYLENRYLEEKKEKIIHASSLEKVKEKIKELKTEIKTSEESEKIFDECMKIFSRKEEKVNHSLKFFTQEEKEIILSFKGEEGKERGLTRLALSTIKVQLLRGEPFNKNIRSTKIIMEMIKEHGEKKPLFSQEEIIKILGISVYEREKIGIHGDTFSHIQKKLKEGKELNPNLETTQKLIQYARGDVIKC